MMSLIDKLLERRARAAAQTASRRGMLKSLGGVLVGATAVPLLPVARAELPCLYCPWREQKAGLRDL